MTPVDWGRAQRALHEAAGRAAALLRTVRDRHAPALGQWSIGDLGMHLSQVWLAVPNLAARDLSPFDGLVPGRADGAGEALMLQLSELASITRQAVEADPERDLDVLADRIEERAGQFLALCRNCAADERRSWLVRGTQVPMTALAGHLLNETLVHGWDIATAEGRPWTIERAEAATVIDGFLMPTIRQLEPRALVDQQAAAGVRATYDLAIRGGGRWHLLFDDGELHVEDPGDRPVDCHVSADPAALLLVIWGRQSQWKAIARGQLLAWGRKPWLGLELRPMMINP